MRGVKFKSTSLGHVQIDIEHNLDLDLVFT